MSHINWRQTRGRDDLGEQRKKIYDEKKMWLNENEMKGGWDESRMRWKKDEMRDLYESVIEEMCKVRNVELSLELCPLWINQKTLQSGGIF